MRADGRFANVDGAVLVPGNTSGSVRSFVLAHCTYCLITRGNSPHGSRVTFTRGCFTMRAHITRMVRRQLLSCSHIRTHRGLTRARGHLFNILCRHNISSGKFKVVHDGNSRTLFHVGATVLGHGLKTPRGHTLTSFLPALNVGTGSFTTRVADDILQNISLERG